MNYQKQATDFLTKAKATIKIELAKNQSSPLWAKPGDDYGLTYNITIERENCQPWTFRYWGSIADKEDNKRPIAYDVLACLTKYNPGTFADFCASYGYDEDSRIAEKTFLAVIEEWNRCEAMFGDLMEELAEIN